MSIAKISKIETVSLEKQRKRKRVRRVLLLLPSEAVPQG